VVREKEDEMSSEEALKIAERISKYPSPGLSQQQAKRALIMYFLKMLEQHLQSTKT
jgi:hypothetical protein